MYITQCNLVLKGNPHAIHIDMFMVVCWFVTSKGLASVANIYVDLINKFP